MYIPGVLSQCYIYLESLLMLVSFHKLMAICNGLSYMQLYCSAFYWETLILEDSTQIWIW